MKKASTLAKLATTPLASQAGPSGSVASPADLRRTVGSPFEPFSLLYALEQHRRTLEILLLLSRENRVTKSRLRQRLKPGQDALNGALGCLERLGLVEDHAATDFPFGKGYDLTDRGRALLAAPLPAWSSVLRE